MALDRLFFVDVDPCVAALRDMQVVFTAHGGEQAAAGFSCLCVLAADLHMPVGVRGLKGAGKTGLVQTSLAADDHLLLLPAIVEAQYVEALLRVVRRTRRGERAYAAHRPLRAYRVGQLGQCVEIGRRGLRAGERQGRSAAATLAVVEPA